jgi:hypothetical protein
MRFLTSTSGVLPIKSSKVDTVENILLDQN